MAIKRGSKVEINSSSSAMTDLMFLLLIFLMIATTMINPNAIKLSLPKSSVINKEKPITAISITSELQYFIETEQVEFADLESRLRARVEGIESPTVAIHADETVAIGVVVKVSNIARAVGAAPVLATLPE